MKSLGWSVARLRGKRWFYGLVGTSFLGLVSPLAAQEPPRPPQNPQGPTQLPPTTVVGERPGTVMPGMPFDQFSPQGAPGLSPFIPPGEGSGGRAANLLGISPSASQGTISQLDIQNRPMLRTPDVLQTVPGLVVAVNGGASRTNYYLRGFNLQFGTDFAFFVDGAPVNLPANVHSQGYADLNFLIPEVIRGIDYGKGPYFPEVGDFSSAGFANINTFSQLPYGFAKVELGQFNYWRTVVGDSGEVGPGVLLFAVETKTYDGPWVVHENLRQFKAFAKYTVADDCGGMALSFSAYEARFRSQEPIPLRAVESGALSRFGSLDGSDGGFTSRYSLNGQFWRKWEGGNVTQANAYLTYYTLNIFENETFFLDDPELGDQINEKERRWTTGLNLAHEIPGEFFGLKTKHTVGSQIRQDWIPVNNHVGTAQRQVVDPLSVDSVRQFSGGLFYKNETQWAEKVRTMAGVRGDYYNFDVEARVTPENSGSEHDSVLSPKGSLILGPWANTEVYLNAGMSFHSNDAKGVLTVIDQGTGEPLTPLPGLIQSRGAEVGLRSTFIPNLTSTVALWYLKLDSELIFRGDEGVTEPLPASRRHGIEWTNNYQVNDWFSLFADFADSTARFSEFNPAGQHVPGAVEAVVDGGFTAKAPNGLYTTWNVRFLGPRALIEDNSARSKSTTVVNMETGWEQERFKVAVVFLNLFDSHDHDTDYFFASRLPGEPLDGVPDIHFRPLERFSVRAYAMYKW